ncbi:ATPase [Deferribacterales bacterium]|nr:ATPase [Deferribacterales bacterium]
MSSLRIRRTGVTKDPEDFYVRQTDETRVALYYINNILSRPVPVEWQNNLCEWLSEVSVRLLGITNFGHVWDAVGKSKLDIKKADWKSIAALRGKKSNEERLPRNIDTMRKVIAKMGEYRQLKHDKKLKNIFALFDIAPQNRELLAFIIYAGTLPMVDRLCEYYIDRLKEQEEHKLLANLVGVSTGDIKRSLSPNSELITKGFMKAERDKGKLIRSLTSFFERVMTSPCQSKSAIKRFILGKPAKATLSLHQFDYMANGLGTIKSILSATLKKQLKGVNILLYGIPGTGKTELTKTLAREVNAELYSISEENVDGDKRERLGELALAQTVLRGDRDTLLLFDEAEDAFYQNPYNSAKQSSKLYFNRMLENNKTPVIWISNNIKGLDRAYLRRFTYALNVKKPDDKALATIWKSSAKKHRISLDDERIDKLSKTYELAPAIIDSALKTSAIIKDIDAIEKVINSLQKASFGYSPKRRQEDSTKFTSELLNCSIDLEQLAQKIISNKIVSFSMCLYGAPGTGKSAYARYLADKLNMKVLHKRASDLISMYVGQTEQNIAMAFNEALEKNGLLIFDEADSFLRDRRNAHHSWEVSQVNEMLTQMESHPLPFVCTTNLMDGLDSASLRRFTFKVKYNYLKDTQLATAFKHFFGSLPNASLKGLNYLAPGDFAVVANKANIMQITEHSELIEMLREEQAVKSKDISGMQVGFSNKYAT